MTSTKRAWRNEEGSIVLALLVVITLSIVAGTLISLLALQGTAVKTQQEATDAEQAAYNALVLGMQAVSTTYPIDNGSEVELWNVGTLPDQPASWLSQGTWSEQPNTQRRWWVTVPSGAAPSQLILSAEGRAGVGNPSQYLYVAYLTYNFNTQAWETSSIIANGNS